MRIEIIIFAAMFMLLEFNFALWIPLIGFLLLAAAISLLFIQLTALRERLGFLDTMQRAFERRVHQLNNPQKASVKNTIEPNFSELDKLKNEIDELKREVELKVELKVKINELKNEVELLKAKLKDDVITSKVIAPRLDERPKIEPSREVFYLSTPNEDGSFFAKSVFSSYKEGVSIYRFTRISHGQAEFQIVERETSIKLALEYPDKNIYPVCEAQNLFNPKAGRIVTVQAGKVVLDRDKWKVTKKAVIRYEH